MSSVFEVPWRCADRKARVRVVEFGADGGVWWSWRAGERARGTLIPRRPAITGCRAAERGKHRAIDVYNIIHANDDLRIGSKRASEGMPPGIPEFGVAVSPRATTSPAPVNSRVLVLNCESIGNDDVPVLVAQISQYVCRSGVGLVPNLLPRSKPFPPINRLYTSEEVSRSYADIRGYVRLRSRLCEDCARATGTTSAFAIASEGEHADQGR